VFPAKNGKKDGHHFKPGVAGHGRNADPPEKCLELNVTPLLFAGMALSSKLKPQKREDCSHCLVVQRIAGISCPSNEPNGGIRY
jgi:hypothetical protein